MKKVSNTILTAADAYYFRTFCQFAYTFNSQKEYENSDLICYDLGFTDKQLSYLEELIRSIPNLTVRKFDFSKYPDFVGLEYKTYSFKPIIVNQIYKEKKGNILWLDSATILFDQLNYVWEELNEHSIYAPIGGSGTLKEWTVQETLDYMEVPKVNYQKRNICGCMCGFGYRKKDVRELVEEWERYSLIHECIKPKNANRTNHRDDQSILTILLYKFQEERELFLTKDEVNISSKNPVKYLSVRNKLRPNFPYSLNFLSVFYFRIVGSIDRVINKIAT